MPSPRTRARPEVVAPSLGPGPTVVGYDGSEQSRRALLWAVRRTAPDSGLIAVAAHGHEPGPLPLVDVLVDPLGAGTAQREQLSRAWAADGAAVADAAQLRVLPGHPADVLAATARDSGASMVVIGHRRGRRLSSLRASVARDLVATAPCPVAVISGVVPGGAAVVVGYDGSEGAREALRWTLRHSGPDTETVVAVAERDRLGTRLPPPFGLGAHDRESLADALLDELVLTDTELLSARFSTTVFDGRPGAALRDIAQRIDAREIIVGRGAHTREVLEATDRPVIVVPGACSTS